MVSIHFLTSSEGLLQGFLMEGHAGAGEAGQDVVCAAISSAAYLVVNTLTDICHVTPLTLRAEEGRMSSESSQGMSPAVGIFSRG